MTVRWFVDNSDPRTPTDSRYSVLVAIPLSAMDSPFSGNLCVIPEGHERVYDLLLAKQRDRDRAGGSSGSSGSGSVGYNLSDELDMNKPDLGEPLQVPSSPPPLSCSLFLSISCDPLPPLSLPLPLSGGGCPWGCDPSSWRALSSQRQS
jgi:hypothetical protein